MNDLEAMSLLAKQNKDIRMSADIIQIQQKKKHGEITFAISTETASRAMKAVIGSSPYYMVCYAIPKDDFNTLKELDYVEELQKLK